MRIDLIKLKNFRPYVDEEIIFSSDEKKKNFTIIQGANGAGKSSLLNAITWCLYDEEIHLTKGLKGLPLCNTEAFDNLEKGKILNVEVEIQMIDEEGRKHNVIRSINYRKDSDGQESIVPDPSSKEKDGSIFMYFREENGQSKKLPEPRFFLEQIMPEDIKEYFFFDGEQLNQYFKESSGEKIKEAVFNVSQITVIENLIDRLIRKRRDLIRDSGDLGPNIERLKEEIKIRGDSLENYKTDLKKKKWDKEQAEKIENEKSEELRQYPDSAEYENRRIEIEEKIEKIEDDIKFLKGEKLKRLLKVSNSIIAYDALVEAKKMVDKGIADGKYPPDAKKDFIEPLLKKNKCICGRDLTDPKCKKLIKDLLKRISTDSDICSEVIGMQGKLREMIDQIESFDEEQVELSKKIRDFRKKVRKHNIWIRYARDKGLKYDPKMEKWSSVHGVYKLFNLGKPPRMSIIENNPIVNSRVMLLKRLANYHKRFEIDAPDLSKLPSRKLDRFLKNLFEQKINKAGENEGILRSVLSNLNNHKGTVNY